MKNPNVNTELTAIEKILNIEKRINTYNKLLVYK